MFNKFAKTAKGLAIAVTILPVCSVMLFGVVVVAVFSAVSFGAAQTSAPSSIQSITKETTSDTFKEILENDIKIEGWLMDVFEGTPDEVRQQLRDSIISGDVAASLGDIVKDEELMDTFVIICLLAACIAYLLGSTLALIAGILGIRRAKKPERYMAAFIWTLAAASYAFVLQRYILLALLVLLAVYEYKARKFAREQAQNAPLNAVGYATPAGYQGGNYQGGNYQGNGWQANQGVSQSGGWQTNQSVGQAPATMAPSGDSTEALYQQQQQYYQQQPQQPQQATWAATPIDIEPATPQSSGQIEAPSHDDGLQDKSNK